MIERTLPDDHIWLRLTKPHYVDPFDASFARRRGGRWNPPDSWPTLYLNADMATVRAQVVHMFAGRGIEVDDLDDDAEIELAAATLPAQQRVADIVSGEGIEAVGLPHTYPFHDDGSEVDHDQTQPIGAAISTAGLRGVWCRSAAGTGTELAWFPTKGAAARPIWDHPLAFAQWRRATDVSEIARTTASTPTPPRLPTTHG